MQTLCGSCSREVELVAAPCRYCGGSVARESNSLAFALAYEELDEEARSAGWKKLARSERLEARRLLGSTMPRSPRSAVSRKWAWVLVAVPVLVIGVVAVRPRGEPLVLEVNPLATSVGDATSGAAAALRVDLVGQGRVPKPCGPGLEWEGTATGLERAALRIEPSARAERVVTARGGEAAIDASTKLQIVCRADDWLQIVIMQPPRFRGTKGWLPSSAVDSRSEALGTRPLIRSQNLTWDETTRPYRTRLVDAVNLAVRRSPRCREVDLETLSAVSGSESPNFFIVCNPSGEAFNLWFDLDGRHLNRRSSVVLAGSEASDFCEAAARQSAAVPDSVRYERDDETSLAYPQGVLRIVAPFSAADPSGARQKFRLLCLFEDGLMTESSIAH